MASLVHVLHSVSDIYNVGVHMDCLGVFINWEVAQESMAVAYNQTFEKLMEESGGSEAELFKLLVWDSTNIDKDRASVTYEEFSSISWEITETEVDMQAPPLSELLKRKKNAQIESKGDPQLQDYTATVSMVGSIEFKALNDSESQEIAEEKFRCGDVIWCYERPIIEIERKEPDPDDC